MLGGIDPESIPDQEEYELHLSLAIKRRWLEPVPDELDTYKRIGHKHIGLYESRLLADEIVRTIEQGR